MHWQLQDAKNRFSEVVRMAATEGPQVITVRGKEEAILIAKKDFDALSHAENDLVEVLQQSPFADLELKFEREVDPGRDIDL